MFKPTSARGIRTKWREFSRGRATGLARGWSKWHSKRRLRYMVWPGEEKAQAWGKHMSDYHSLESDSREVD